jgi:site-specific DNA-methyltransferase (cytosine-N4-specific)
MVVSRVVGDEPGTRTGGDPMSALMIRGDARSLPLADASVHMVVTSPPYLMQRVYGTDAEREMGQTSTLTRYVLEIASVFDEIERVLIPGGFVWLNIGDKANNSGGAGGDWSGKRLGAIQQKAGRFADPGYSEVSYLDVPGAVVRELLLRGWRLRMPIVWDKGRDAPESLRYVNRPRWRHEMIFLLTPTRRARGKRSPIGRARFYTSGLVETGSIWRFPAGGDGDPHLAPFPDELARRAILASTLPGDVVLDPFAGSGTVARVADRMGRHGVGVELYAGRPDLLGVTPWEAAE